MTIKHYADDETGHTIIATDPMHSDGGVRLNDSPVGDKRVTAPHHDQDSADALRAYFQRDAGLPPIADDIFRSIVRDWALSVRHGVTAYFAQNAADPEVRSVAQQAVETAGRVLAIIEEME